MSNKRIIRVIIYEGDEELVDAYERHSLQQTQNSHGMPKYWQEPPIERGKEVFISGATLKEEIGLFQAIDIHNAELKKRLKTLIKIVLQSVSLEEPILNQLN